MVTLMPRNCLRLSPDHQGTSSYKIQRTIAEAVAFMCGRAPVDPRLAKMSKICPERTLLSAQGEAALRSPPAHPRRATRR